MSTNVCGDRFHSDLTIPVTAGSPAPAPLSQPPRAPSRCDRIIALIDAALSETEGLGMDGTTPLELEIDEVLDGRGGPPLFAGHDRTGQSYLAAQIARTSTASSWLCAPTSRIALRCVSTGRAEPRDAFLHSQTGYVIVITVDRDGVEMTSIRLCADLPDDLWPWLAGWLHRDRRPHQGPHQVGRRVDLVS